MDLKQIAKEAAEVADWVELARGLAEGQEWNHKPIYISKSGILLREPPTNEEYLELTSAIIKAITDRNEDRLATIYIELSKHTTIEESEEDD